MFLKNNYSSAYKSTVVAILTNLLQFVWIQVLQEVYFERLIEIFAMVFLQS